jgi:hypothetical protein
LDAPKEVGVIPEADVFEQLEQAGKIKPLEPKAISVEEAAQALIDHFTAAQKAASPLEADQAKLKVMEALSKVGDTVLPKPQSLLAPEMMERLATPKFLKQLNDALAASPLSNFLHSYADELISTLRRDELLAGHPKTDPDFRKAIRTGKWEDLAPYLEQLQPQLIDLHLKQSNPFHVSSLGNLVTTDDILSFAGKVGDWGQQFADPKFIPQGFRLVDESVKDTSKQVRKFVSETGTSVIKSTIHK